MDDIKTMLPLPYVDLLDYLETIPGFRGITEKATYMSTEDIISMLFSYIRPFVAEVKAKDKLNKYLDYGLKSYDSAVISGVIDNDLLDNDMIGKLSEEFGVWETIRSLIAANPNAEEAVLQKMIAESEGLGLCILAAKLELTYPIFIAVVEKKDKNANRILSRRQDLPQEWRVIIALVGS